MKRATISVVTLLLWMMAPAALLADDSLRFTGTENARTPTFETSGPWLLDWSVRGDFPQMTNFELRLYDASTGQFVGTITQLEGIGRGLKLFEDAGTWEIQVVSKALTWTLEIAEIGTDRAAELKRAADGQSTTEDLASIEARRIAEGTFASWRPVDDSTLLLYAEDESRGFRVSFDPPCPGLGKVTALSFMAAPGGGPERFDSILLDDGTRCFFGRVVPTVFE